MLALTHASCPQKKESDNEKLEFLGDRVLGFVLSDCLFGKTTFSDVGSMAHYLSFLASRSVCARVADRLNLFDYAFLSKGLSRNWNSNVAVHANLCEALIGAIYLDGGLEAARNFVQTFWQKWLSQDYALEDISPKNALQEWAQSRGLTPAYRLVSSKGADHAPLFLVEVAIEGEGVAQGESSSLQGAEKIAAQNLLRQKL